MVHDQSFSPLVLATVHVSMTLEPLRLSLGQSVGIIISLSFPLHEIQYVALS